MLSEVSLGTSAEYSAIAGFYATPSPVPPVCPGTAVGSCCFIPAGTTSPAATPESAGDVEIDKGSTQLGQLTFGSSGYSQISSLSMSSLVWTAGESLTFVSAGDTVDAFQTTAAAPDALAGVSPSLGGSSPIAITRASGFTETWTAGSDGSSFFLALEDSAVNTLTCEVPISDGTLSVPSSLLDILEAGSGRIGVHAQLDHSFTGTNASLAVIIEGSPMNGTVTLK